MPSPRSRPRSPTPGPTRRPPESRREEGPGLRRLLAVVVEDHKAHAPGRRLLNLPLRRHRWLLPIGAPKPDAREIIPGKNPLVIRTCKYCGTAYADCCRPCMSPRRIESPVASLGQGAPGQQPRVCRSLRCIPTGSDRRHDRVRDFVRDVVTVTSWSGTPVRPARQPRESAPNPRGAVRSSPTEALPVAEGALRSPAGLSANDG